MSAPDQAKDDTAGIIFAASAYIFWSVMPLYWRLLDSVPPVELTVHRIFWCALFAGAIAIARGRLPALLQIVRSPRLFATLALTAVLISINWGVYIYCVATRQLVEASLGYYINPLISIALGVILFGERISRMRQVAIALVTVAVAMQAFSLGYIPWIAPVLAISFGFYGYFRKLTPVDSLDGLTIETWVLLPVTGSLIWFWSQHDGAFPSPHLSIDGLLILGGPLTALPLAMFAAGARRIRLSTLGFLQYLSPSITLLLAVFGLGEHFTKVDLATFGLVWVALAIVSLDSLLSRSKEPISNPEPA